MMAHEAKPATSSPGGGDVHHHASSQPQPAEGYPPPLLLTPSQVESFVQDGYLFMRGLFSQQQVDAVRQAAKQVRRRLTDARKGGGFQTFSVVEKGMIYAVPPPSESSTSNDDADEDDKKIVDAFRQIAIRSKMGQVAAELMQLDPHTQNVRILRDVFLAKPINTEEICDWHVDDQGFWPEQYRSIASDKSNKDQYGINAWIALDEMPARYEGSMAVAKGSHDANWKDEAYKFIGQNRAADKSMTRDELVTAFSGVGTNNNRQQTPNFTTCGIDKANPQLRERIEKSRVVFDLKVGDVIFATRLLFHRTLQVTEEGKVYYASKDVDSLMRYSVRYVPGTATLPSGYHPFEWSIVSNPNNGGKQLNDVVAAADDGDNNDDRATPPLWYPQVWPTIELDVDAKLDSVVASGQLDEAKRKANDEKQNLMKAVQERTILMKQQQEEQNVLPTPG